MASREISASDSPPADSRHQVPDHATARGPKLAMTALVLAWGTMAVLAVTVLRPELAGVKHTERAPAIAGQPGDPGTVRSPSGPWRQARYPVAFLPASPRGSAACTHRQASRHPGGRHPGGRCHRHARRPSELNAAADGASAPGTDRRALPGPLRGIHLPGTFELGQHLLPGGERIINRLDHQGHPSLRLRPRIPLKPRKLPGIAPREGDLSASEQIVYIPVTRRGRSVAHCASVSRGPAEPFSSTATAS